MIEKDPAVKRSPNSVDVHVGSRVRSRRLAIGMTQDKLARALGLTFQQIQKYEKGANRIGAGRLQAISRILEAPLAYFYADAPGAANAKLNEVQGGARTQPSSVEALNLVKGFLSIPDPAVREHVLALVHALAHPPKREDDPA